MSTMRDLQERRERLNSQLSELRKKRERAFRANSDALARERAGVAHRGEVDMKDLAGAETAGDDSMTELRREIESIDSELDGGQGIGRRIMRLLGK